MSGTGGTVKTDAQLKAEFAPNTTGAITAQDEQDLIVSETAHWQAGLQGALVTLSQVSPDNTTVTNVAQSIVDSAGNVWSLSATNTLSRNGTADGTLTNVSKIVYKHSTVYVQAGQYWYFWNSKKVAPSVNLYSDSLFSSGSTGIIGAGGSPGIGWNVNCAGSLTGTIVNIGTDVTSGLPYFDLQLTGTAGSGNLYVQPPMVVVNASTAYTFAVSLACIAGSMAGFGQTQIDVDYYNASGYASSINQSVTLNNNLQSFPLSFTTAAGITHTQSYFASTFTNGASINATLRFAGLQLQQGSASHFTPTPAFVAGWTATTSPYTQAPAQAVSAGYTQLVFEDDFTAQTVAPNPFVTSGYKWYWNYQTTSSSDFTINTSATAASVSNGNSGGGNNFSSQGGILSINCSTNGSAVISVPGTVLNNPTMVTPPLGGSWQHGYFEAYMQFQLTNPNGSQGWPAFYLWAVEALKQYGFGNSGVSLANPPGFVEIDIMESYGTNFSSTPGSWTPTIHQWPANTIIAGNATSPSNTITAGWNTFGCLWSVSSSNTGMLSFYLNNQLVQFPNGVTSFTTGSGQTISSLEIPHHMFIIINGGTNNWTVNVDWVRVWQ